MLGASPSVAQTPTTALVPDGDGGMHLRTTLPEPGAVRYTFEAPGESSVVVAWDSSVAVVGSDDELRGGLAAPVVTDTTGSEVPSSWTEVDDIGGLLALDLAPDGYDATGESADASADDTAAASDPAVAYPLTVDVYLGQAVVASVEWGEREGGRSLAVTPTAWGRASGTTGRTYGWDDVVRLDPSADTSVMRKQFLCHVDGAREKDTWNLEPWRPDISFIGYLIARCNPA
ncbi:DUF2599 domain-containing protein [Sanguibacter antarcticus]|nr:DUF2599 domain-containing protein [Sanguibacter antarcticus]